MEDTLQFKIKGLGMPLGVILWRQVGKGSKLPEPDAHEPDYLCKIFVTSSKIDDITYIPGKDRVVDVTSKGDRYRVAP